MALVEDAMRRAGIVIEVTRSNSRRFVVLWVLACIISPSSIELAYAEAMRCIVSRVLVAAVSFKAIHVH